MKVTTTRSPERWTRHDYGVTAILALLVLTIAFCLTCVATVYADRASASVVRYAPAATHTRTACIDANTTQGRVRLDNTRSTRAVTFEVTKDYGNEASRRYVTVNAGQAATRIVRVNTGHAVTTTVGVFDATAHTWTMRGRYCATAAHLTRTTTTLALKVTNRTGSARLAQVYTDRGPDVQVHYLTVPAHSSRTYLDGIPRAGIKVEAWVGSHRLLARNLTR